MLLRVWPIFTAAVVLLSIGVRPVDAAVVDPELARALAHYERGEFEEAAPILERTLKAGELNDADRRKALEALGVSYYVMGRLLDARKQFTSLLELDPGYEPDAFYVPPEIVAFVADIRNSRAAQAVTAETKPAEATSKAPANPRRPEGPAVQRTPDFRALDLVPFGMAQFRKGHADRAWTLAVTQGLLLGSNIGLYYYRRCRLKSGCDSKYYPDENLEQARRLQSYQLVAGYLFLGTAVLGIVDGVSLPVGRAPLSVAPVGTGVGLKWRIE